MHSRLAVAFALGATAFSVSAQQSTEHKAAPAAPDPVTSEKEVGGEIRIPAGTQVTFEIESPLGSKLSKTGDTFPIRLWQPLIIEGVEVLPKGTPGKGEVIHAARARAAGKAGELILAARSLDAGAQQIRLRSFEMAAQSQVGESNSGKAMAVSLLAAPLALFVVGGEVNIPAGTVANAKVAEDINAQRIPKATPN